MIDKTFIILKTFLACQLSKVQWNVNSIQHEKMLYLSMHMDLQLYRLLIIFYPTLPYTQLYLITTKI